MQSGLILYSITNDQFILKMYFFQMWIISLQGSKTAQVHNTSLLHLAEHRPRGQYLQLQTILTQIQLLHDRLTLRTHSSSLVPQL